MVESTNNSASFCTVARTGYRGALSWMREVSESLNPEDPFQMMKYRRVQERVRVTKAKFDATKLQTLEKIDLLAISRQGMLSQNLGGYQKSLTAYHRRMEELYGQLAKDIQITGGLRFTRLPELNDLVSKCRVGQQPGASSDPDLIAVDDAASPPIESAGDEGTVAPPSQAVARSPDFSPETEQNPASGQDEGKYSSRMAARGTALTKPFTPTDLFLGWDESEVGTLKEIFRDMPLSGGANPISEGPSEQGAAKLPLFLPSQLLGSKPAAQEADSTARSSSGGGEKGASLDNWYSMLSEIDLMDSAGKGTAASNARASKSLEESV